MATAPLKNSADSNAQNSDNNFTHMSNSLAKHARQKMQQPSLLHMPSASLAEALGVQPGITAIIGSGGKTSLLRALSRELLAEGNRVLLTTTTHILPFKDLPCLRISSNDNAALVMKQLTELVENGMQAHHNSCSWEICLGSGLLPACGASLDKSQERSANTLIPDSVKGSANTLFNDSSKRSASFNPKLSSPGFPIYELLPAADYILTEADGARHHYMKAHAHYEPVIPERCGRTILVIGVKGFGMQVAEAVHRPEIFCRMTGASSDAVVTPALYAEFLRQEIENGLAFDCILLNGVDCEERCCLAEEFAAEIVSHFDGPVVLADLPLA